MRTTNSLMYEKKVEKCRGHRSVFGVMYVIVAKRNCAFGRVLMWSFRRLWVGVGVSVFVLGFFLEIFFSDPLF